MSTWGPGSKSTAVQDVKDAYSRMGGETGTVKTVEGDEYTIAAAPAPSPKNITRVMWKGQEVEIKKTIRRIDPADEAPATSDCINQAYFGALEAKRHLMPKPPKRSQEFDQDIYGRVMEYGIYWNQPNPKSMWEEEHHDMPEDLAVKITKEVTDAVEKGKTLSFWEAVQKIDKHERKEHKKYIDSVAFVQQVTGGGDPKEMNNSLLNSHIRTLINKWGDPPHEKWKDYQNRAAESITGEVAARELHFKSCNSCQTCDQWHTGPKNRKPMAKMNSDEKRRHKRLQQRLRKIPGLADVEAPFSRAKQREVVPLVDKYEHEVKTRNWGIALTEIKNYIKTVLASGTTFDGPTRKLGQSPGSVPTIVKRARTLQSRVSRIPGFEQKIVLNSPAWHRMDQLEEALDVYDKHFRQGEEPGLALRGIIAACWLPGDDKNCLICGTRFKSFGDRSCGPCIRKSGNA